jgi:hypothetical protein
MKRSLLQTIIIAIVAALIAGCAGYAPTSQLIGKGRDQVVQSMGKPSTELRLADGSVMIFPRGSKGKHTYFVYLNAEGEVIRWTQVLDEKNFAMIKPGMHRDDVVAIIGDAKDVNGLARDRGYVWNYRYVNANCLWFNIEFSRENLVRSTGYSRVPECRFKGG